MVVQQGYTVGNKDPHMKQLLIALAGNRTRVNCLEGSYAHHYTTNAYALVVKCFLSLCSERGMEFEIVLRLHKKDDTGSTTCPWKAAKLTTIAGAHTQTFLNAEISLDTFGVLKKGRFNLYAATRHRKHNSFQVCLSHDALLTNAGSARVYCGA